MDNSSLLKEENNPIKSRTYVVLMVLNATLGSFYFGYEMAVLNTSEDKLTAHFKWDKHDKDLYIPWIVSIISISALFGALLAGPLSKLGRRVAIILTDVFSILAIGVCLLSFYNINVWVLLLGRLLCGISVGLNSALVPLYIREISPI